MTESTNIPTHVPESSPKLVRPFESLRVDPKKAGEGVWIQHPDTEDQLQVRRLWCAEHARAYLQAKQDYEAQHGKGSADTDEGTRTIDAIAMATGVVIAWRIAADPERPYDPAAFAALLADPGMADLRAWIGVQSSRRENFRTEDVAGN